jgi:hypothetical protein
VTEIRSEKEDTWRSHLMVTKKQFVILTFVFLFAAAIYQPQVVEALPFDGEYTNQEILADHWFKVYDTMTAGDTITGYFETHQDTQGLDFFICDSGNLSLWEGGFSAYVFESDTNMHTLGFEFTVPYNDDWTCVFSNDGGVSTITADIGVDLNGDGIPFFSSSEYTHTGYGVVLEDEEYYAIPGTYGAGTVIDGEFWTLFPTDGVDFFICDQANYELWIDGYSITGYSTQEDMHHAFITDFTIPTTGMWYCVFYAQAEVDTITVCYGINADTSGAVTTSESTGAELNYSVSWLGILAVAIIGVVLCVVCRGRRGGGTPSSPTVDHYVAPPSSPSHSGTVREREVTTRVLVVCPYCGAKNEQGILHCHNCDAEL